MGFRIWGGSSLPSSLKSHFIAWQSHPLHYRTGHMTHNCFWDYEIGDMETSVGVSNMALHDDQFMRETLRGPWQGASGLWTFVSWGNYMIWIMIMRAHIPIGENTCNILQYGHNVIGRTFSTCKFINPACRLRETLAITEASHKTFWPSC